MNTASHARRPLRSGDVDRQEARVRMRAADEAGMQHARQLDVVQIASLPAQQPLELAARNPCTDAGAIRRRAIRHYDLAPMLLPPLASITAATASMMA